MAFTIVRYRRVRGNLGEAAIGAGSEGRNISLRPSSAVSLGPAIVSRSCCQRQIRGVAVCRAG